MKITTVKIVLVFTFTILVALAPSGQSGAHERVDAKDYIGFTGPWQVNDLLGDCDLDPNLGGACFNLQGDEQEVTITVADITGPLPVALILFDPTPTSGLLPPPGLPGHVSFSCLPATFTVPDAAEKVVVFTGDPAVGALAASEHGCPASYTPIAGTVTATFSLAP